MKRFEKSPSSLRHANILAKIALEESFNTVGETQGKAMGVPADTLCVSGEGFVIWLLNKEEGPTNENRILKQMRENKVRIGRHNNTHDLLTSMLIEGYVECIYAARTNKPARLVGYILTKKMKSLIESHKTEAEA